MTRRIEMLMGISAALLLCAVGCNDVASEVATTKAVPPPPPPPPIEVENGGSVTPTEASPAVEENAAEVGFGAKGHYDSNDYVSVVISSQYRGMESITLSRIVNAMQQYKAINGHFPKTEETYFKEVIEAHGITLPELPAGHKYGYDPELAERERGQKSLTVLEPK